MRINKGGAVVVVKPGGCVMCKDSGLGRREYERSAKVGVSPLRLSGRAGRRVSEMGHWRGSLMRLEGGFR